MAVKQVILIRRDLNMRRGKEIAQGSHASLAFIAQQVKNFQVEESSSENSPTSPLTKELSIHLSPEAWQWFTKGSAKICLKVETEEELVKLHKEALTNNLESHIIVDSGKTEFKGEPTITACAIGPNEAQEIDNITGHLKTN